MKRILPLLLLTLVMILQMGFSPKVEEPTLLQFEEIHIKLGAFTCAEMAGKASGFEVKYRYQNMLQDTVWVESFKGSGGIFIPAGRDEYVLPGEKGYLSGQLYCQGRVGNFHKSLTLIVKVPNAYPHYQSVISLFVSGEMIPEEKPEVLDTLPGPKADR